jgi:cytochrome c oxidase subunit II
MLSVRLVLIVGIVFLTSTFAAGYAESPRRIEITAQRFSYNPASITLKKNEPVILVLRTADVTHGLKVSEFQITTTEIKKGKDTEIRITPEESGHYVGKCAHFCGKGHGSMALQIEVVP